MGPDCIFTLDGKELTYDQFVDVMVAEGGIPNAPFKNNAWAELAIKRVLRLAAEEGYDSVAWTTGEIQANRYDLSKQVDKVQWFPEKNILKAWKDNKNVISKPGVTEKSLEDFIGKDAAGRLINSETNRDGFKEISGEQLKVGGEGMKGFYDRVLPNLFKKVAGKLDSTTSIKQTAISDVATVQSIQITNKIRQSAMQGQPLFKREVAYSDSAVIPHNKNPIGLNKEFVQKVVDEFMEGVKSDIRVVVHNTQKDATGRDTIVAEDGRKVRIKSAIKDNEVILIAKNLNGRSDIESVLRHEVFWHYGFSLFDEKTRDDIENKINATRNDPKHKENWDYILDHYDDAAPEVQANEFMARLAETPAGRMTRIYREVLAMIQSALRKIGWLKGNITQSELHALLRAAERQARGTDKLKTPPTESTQFARFSSLGEKRVSLETTLKDVEQILGFKSPFDVVVSKELSPDTPMAFDLDRRVVLVNSKHKPARALAAQYMTEEVLHGIDAVGPRRTISASSKLLKPEGQIYKEVVNHYKENGKVSYFLDYPLNQNKYNLSDSVVEAELFARLGVLYLGDPQLMREVLPNAYRSYSEIFGLEIESPVTGAFVFRKVWGLGTGVTGKVLREHLADGKTGRHASGANRQQRPSEGLGGIRQAISRALHGRILGEKVHLNDPPELKSKIKTKAPSQEGVSVSGDDKNTITPNDSNILYSKSKSRPEIESAKTILQKLGVPLQKNSPRETVAYLVGGETALTTHPSTQKQNKLKTYVKRYFSKEGLLTDEAFDRHIESMGMKNESDLVTQFMVDGLIKESKQAYLKPWGKIPESTKEQMNEYLAGNNDADVKPRVKEALDAMRISLDNMSGNLQQMVIDEIMYRLHALPEDQRGNAIKAIKDKSANLEESGIDPFIASKVRLYRTIGENKRTYLNRSYRVFDDENWKDAVDPDVKDRARKYLREQADRDKRFDRLSDKAKEDYAEGIINKLLNPKQKDLLSFMGSGQLGQKDLSIMKRRKDIAPEIRELMGEYKDPRLNYARTMTKMAYLVANHHFLKSVREDGLGVFLSAEPSGLMFEEITSWDQLTMAPLAGLYTTPEFASALRNAVNPKVVEGWLKSLLLVSTAVKYGKTVLSPTTMARNFYSAAMFTIMNGHFNWTHAVKAGAHTWADLGSSNIRRLDYLRKLVKLGVLHDNPKAQELREALDDVSNMNTLEGGLTARSIKSLLNGATKAYRAGDDFWKIIGFENERANLIRHGMPIDQAEKMAADRIRNGYPTYSMVPESIRMLRRFPANGAFVSFPWEILRTTSHQFRMMNEDRKAGRTDMFAKRAIGMLISISASYAISLITMSMMGLTEEDDEAIRRLGPTWQEDAQLAYLGHNKDDQLVYLDLSHLDPYTYLKSPFVVMANGNYETVDEKAVAAISSFLKPFLGEEIFFGALMDVWKNKKEHGQVYDENADVWTQGKQVYDHLRKELQPGVFSNVERTLKAWNDEYATYGRKYELSDEALAWIGIRMTTMDPNIALRFRSFEFNDQKSDAGKPVYSVMRNPNLGISDELPEALEATQDQWKKAHKDMLASIRAARKTGMADNEIAEALRLGGVTLKSISALMDGHIPEWAPNLTTLDNSLESILKTKKHHKEKEAMISEFTQRREILDKLLTEKPSN